MLIKQLLIIFLGAFLLAYCNNPKKSNPVENAATRVADTEVRENPNRDTTLEIVKRVIEDPFRDINNFDPSYGDRFIDSLHACYSKQRKGMFVKDVCIGDNCESWEILENKQENTVLYLFKGDGGEYGFSNDQFLLKGDSLVYVRNFTVNIDGWPTDSTATKWKIEEVVYHFQGETSTITTRSVLTKDIDHVDFTLREVKAKDKNLFDLNKAYQEKASDLEQLLEMKDSPNRE